MKTIQTWKAAAFIATLVIIATVINSTRSRTPAANSGSPQTPVEQPPTKPTISIDSYLNAPLPRASGTHTVAIAVQSENGGFNPAVATALGRQCKPDPLKILPTFFTQRFVADGLFNETFNGSTTPSRDLNLARYVDLLLLGRLTVEYSTNAGLQNVITANVRLEVSSFPVGAWGQNNAWTFTANGAGFRPGDARAMADERVLDQIKGAAFNLASP